MSAGPGTILEDDQQLYDWGIENRLDQYYQVQAEQWFYYVAAVMTIARLNPLVLRMTPTPRVVVATLQVTTAGPATAPRPPPTPSQSQPQPGSRAASSRSQAST